MEPNKSGKFGLIAAGIYDRLFSMKKDRELKLSVSTGTFVRFWLVIIGFLAIAGVIWIAKPALILIVTSFFLALVLNRPVSFFARHLPGKSRSLAIFVSYLIVAALIGLLFFTVVPVFARQLASFMASIPDMLNQLRGNSAWLNDLLSHYNLTHQYNQWIADIQSQLGSVASNIGQFAVSIMSNLFDLIGNLLLILFITFFMLLEAPNWEEKYWRIVYSNEDRRRHHKVLARRMYNVVSGYVTGQATVGLISGTFTAIIVGILATIFNFDISLIWPAWITIFLTVFIPMFGAVIGGGIVSLLLLIYSLPAAIIYVVIFTIEQQIENNVIQPRIQAKHLDISPLIILVSITLGLQVGGLLGALVSIPVAGCLVVLVRDLLINRNKLVARTENADNDIDGILDNSEPVIFAKADRTYKSRKRA